MIKPEALFTRQQIRHRTGIREDLLNYFVREGLLEASEGGGGKGQHRRFKAIEVTLAAIMNQLKSNAGANIGILREVVSSLRDSLSAVEAMPYPAPVMLEAFTDIVTGEPGEVSPVPEEASHFVREHGVWDVRHHVFNYLALTDFNHSRVNEALFLYRTVDGSWIFDTNVASAPDDVITFIAINMNELLCSIWEDKD